MANAKQQILGKHLWELTPYVTPYKGLLWVGTLTNVLARAFDLLPLLIVGLAIDHITATGGAKDVWPFVMYGLMVLGTFIGLALFQSISDYAWSKIAQNVRHDVRLKLYNHMQTLEASFFEEHQTGELLSVVSNDVDNLENFLSDATTSIIRIVITFVGIYGILAWMDWRLSLLLFIPLPLVVFAVRFFATRVQPQYQKARAAVGRINSVIENNIGGMGVIQAYTAERSQSERVHTRSLEYRDSAISAARERAYFIPIIYAVAGLSYSLLIAGGAWMVMGEGGPTIGDYTSFMLFAMRLVMPLFIFSMLSNQIQRCEASAERIFKLLKVPPKIADDANAVKLDGPPRSVRFRGVSFAYPTRSEVIHNVDFASETGKMIGIVGPTGAGKSTLIKLILRYYDPTAGEILINGVPLKNLSLNSLREHIGYVSQEAFIFTGNVAENIMLGSPDATQAQIEEAAKVAGIHDFIVTLPEGYHTMVGERGVKLSGGQRQRVSLARAVLRNPAILLLDEATSAVDTKTEEIIQRNLNDFRSGRITIAVAHRLSTVRQSDEILVLVDGVVIERGSHDALISSCGPYHDLWAVQSGQAGASLDTCTK